MPALDAGWCPLTAVEDDPISTHARVAAVSEQRTIDPVNYRWERITRLLEELKYEVTRGMMEGEIDESIGFRFAVPVSKTFRNGVVACEFRTRPMPAYQWGFDPEPAKLRVVK